MRIHRLFCFALIAWPVLAEQDAPGCLDCKTALGRYAFVNEASAGVRLLIVDSSEGSITNHNLQHQAVLAGGLRFGAQGKYSLHVGLGTGESFAGGWNNSGFGSEPGSAQIFLKRLFLSAKPLSGVALQYGGIGFERGAASDIISYSGDGYLTGQRLTVERPRKLFFDSMVVTYAYLGDLSAPSVVGRLHRLGQGNYQQYLLVKRLGKRTDASVDYTIHSGSKTLRQAFQISAPELLLLDKLSVELYERTNPSSALGFNFSAEKSFRKRTSILAGYAAIDRLFGELNSDAFSHGRRVYLGAKFRIARGLSVSTLFNRAVGNSYAIQNGTHFHIGFSYDIREIWQRARTL